MIIRNTALRQFVRYGTCCLLLNLVLAVALQPAGAAGPLTIDEFAGAVKVKLDHRWQDPQVGMHVTLPATVSTGEDGSIKLARDGSFISVGANTALEFLAGPEPGQLLERVVQNKGSAFYDISYREHRKLRVETPYLAAVIKGTQFNVSVDPRSASVSLFEGLLQIEAPDIGDVIELQAGFIARRQAGDASITVIRMDNGEAASGERSGVGASGSRRPGDGAGAGGGTRVAVGDGDASTGDPGDAVPGATRGDALVDTGTTPDPQDADADDVLQADLDLDGTDLGDTRDLQPVKDPLILEASGSGDLGDGEIAMDLGADTSVGDIDAGLDAGVDADLGSGDLSADLGADADVGDTEVDAGVEADLGSGDLGVDATVGDVGIDVGVDDGSLDVDADLGALDDTVELVDDLLGTDGTDTATDDTEEEEDEALLPDLGNPLGL